MVAEVPSTYCKLPPPPLMIKHARGFQPTSLGLITHLHLLPVLISSHTPNRKAQVGEAKGTAPRQLSQLHLSPKQAWFITKNSLGFVLKLPSGNDVPAYGHMGASI